jgi:quinol monooxygenase YgiN
MSYSTAVSLHPYFKARPGQIQAALALLPAFVAKTAQEPGNLYYDFTVNGDEIFCREAYVSGDATLAHLSNVRELLGQLLNFADVTRVEVHGPAAELESLREALAAFKPSCFIHACGVDR